MQITDVEVHVYSRAYSGGLAWTHVYRDGRRVLHEAPANIQQFETFIDTANTALVIAECKFLYKIDFIFCPEIFDHLIHIIDQITPTIVS
jgi:hypothetical protein